MKQLMENWRRYLNEEKDVVEETEEVIEEAEYQGKKVKLNDPIRTPDGPKKFKVFVKDGDKVKVTFGDPDMEIKETTLNLESRFARDISAIKRKIKPRLVTGLAGNDARAQRWIADETYNGKLEKNFSESRRGFQTSYNV